MLHTIADCKPNVARQAGRPPALKSKIACKFPKFALSTLIIPGQVWSGQVRRILRPGDRRAERPAGKRAGRFWASVLLRIALPPERARRP